LRADISKWDVVVALIALLARLMHSHEDSDLKAIHEELSQRKSELLALISR